MKYKKLILSVVLILGYSLIELQAQEAILTTGGNGLGSGGSISYSVGQVAYISAVGTNGYSLSSGVQQAYEIQILDGIEEASGIHLECVAYPNPVIDGLILKIEASAPFNIQSMEYQLYDLNGNLLQNKKLSGIENTISMGKLNPACYFLKVIDNRKIVKTFKIIKH